MAWISCVGRYSSTNFLPCSRCHSVLFPVFRSPRMTIFTEGKQIWWSSEEKDIFTWVILESFRYCIINDSQSKVLYWADCINCDTYYYTGHPWQSVSANSGSWTVNQPGWASLGSAPALILPASSVPKTWWQNVSGPNKSQVEAVGQLSWIAADWEAQQGIASSWGGVQGPMLTGNSDAKWRKSAWASFKWGCILLLTRLKQ